MMRFMKAQAYGNDFLYVRRDEIDRLGVDPVAVAQAICARHTGIGADGLIVFSDTPSGAAMRLINADGSPSEVSGNGVRGLGAIIARERDLAPRAGSRAAGAPADLLIDTDAGPKPLWLLGRDGDHRHLFRAGMGEVAGLAERHLDVAGESLQLVTLQVGNPQCVLLAPLDEARLARLGAALQRHPAFPDQVNFEIAEVESASRVRILIWERGVGRTESSGTGSCAAAVAAAAFGGASREIDVVAPGGTQRVEWTDEGLWLTGWAEVVAEGTWLVG
jgi:diaminopimelate epimerase